MAGDRLRKVLTVSARNENWRRCDPSALVEAARDLQLEPLLCIRLETMYRRHQLRDSLTLG